MQQLQRFARPQRARHTVAKVHDRIAAVPAKIRQHGFERDQVAVNVGNDGEAHAPSDDADLPEMVLHVRKIVVDEVLERARLV